MTGTRRRTWRALALSLGGAGLLWTGLVGVPAAAGTTPQAGAEQAASDLTELRAGEQLGVGSALVSPDGRYRLLLDGTGLVTLRERASWLTGETEHELLLEQYGDADRLVMQADGNLVAYTATGGVAWDAATHGSGAVALRLGDDRELVLLDATGDVVVEFGTGAYERVWSGTALLPGDVVTGQAGRTRLVMQTDGNLVLYRGGTALWSSRTEGNPGAGAVMQADGNLVVYSSAVDGRRALFDTRTARPVQFWWVPVLWVEDTELSVLQAFEDGGHEARWGSNWSTSRVEAGDELHTGDRRRSPDGRCTLVMQGDRNLVEYCDGRAVFATGRPASRPGLDLTSPEARMQGDGNLVVYGMSMFPEERPMVFFTTGTRAPGSRLLLQDDRNLVVYAPGDRPTWSARTGRIG